MKILALDPSVNDCGWATVEWKDSDEPQWAWGVHHPEGKNILEKFDDLYGSIYLAHIYNQAPLDQIVCEYPQFYNSAKGRVAAKMSYTINLAAEACYIIGRLNMKPEDSFLYTAPKWKGSVPKQVTARRFFRAFDISPRKVDHNAIDAVMILLYHCKLHNLLVAPNKQY